MMLGATPRARSVSARQTGNHGIGEWPCHRADSAAHEREKEKKMTKKEKMAIARYEAKGAIFHFIGIPVLSKEENSQAWDAAKKKSVEIIAKELCNLLDASK